MMKTPYEILNVSPSATKQEIKSAYRKLAKQFHPDVNKQPNASQMFMQIQTAFDALKDGNYIKATVYQYTETEQTYKPKRDRPENRMANLKLYEFYSSGTFTPITIRTGYHTLPAGTKLYLMERPSGRETRVFIENSRDIPFTIHVPSINRNVSFTY